MPHRTFHIACLALVLALALGVAGCGFRAGPSGPALDELLRTCGRELPGDVRALVRETNQLLAQPPDDRRLVRALAAAERAVVAHPGYRTRWRAARAASYVAQWHGSIEVKRAAALRGIGHARAAIEASPERVGGHHFLATNLGLLARLEPDGALARVEQAVKVAEQARELDGGFQRGGPLRFLGATYAQAPPWPTSVGDVEESYDLLEELVERFPNYPLNQYFYGETLVKLGEYDRALKAFRLVLRGPSGGIWRLEGAHFRAAARQHIVDIQRMRALRRGGM